MTTQEIVAKLWILCNVLRDDGITYQDYVTELTYILFLKMADETGAEEHIPEPCRWSALKDLKGNELLKRYTAILAELGGKDDVQGNKENSDVDEKGQDIHHIIKAIYRKATTSIREPKNLEKIIKSIDELDWFSAREEGLGDLYEGLLEKNANEKKSGAGQYFTPRPLIDVMTELVRPQAGELCNDNVLFADGDGASIRRDLMDKCNLHTILRLPTGIFYAQGVKTNVLFFTRGTEDSGNTKEVWFYDLRTNMPSFGKTNPLKKESFAGFMAAYTAEDRHGVTDERWSVCTREEIAAKGDSLDLGLIRDESVVDYEDLPDPVESCKESLARLGEAMDLIQGVMERLKSLQKQG